MSYKLPVCSRCDRTILPSTPFVWHHIPGREVRYMHWVECQLGDAPAERLLALLKRWASEILEFQ